jgi:dolichol-phosphate mannosyltransferase
MKEFAEFTVGNTNGVPKYRVRTYRAKENNTALLIPVLNEGKRILQQLKELNLLDLKVDIVIADGGSNDFTQQNIEKENLGIHSFLTKEESGGLSTQLRMGFHYCVSQEYEFVITMDGNNKDDASGIFAILSALNLGIDFVQGSRFIKGGQAVNTPLVRYIAIRLIHAPLTSLAARYWFTDTTNGFRGHSATLINHPKVQVFRECFKGYELLAYLPIQSKRIGLKVCEVPVVRRYPTYGPIPTKIIGNIAQLNLLKILVQAMRGRFDPF